MKSIFKVSELHHAFMNGLTRHGAKAGALAIVVNRTLSHNGKVPAAAFLHDVQAADGRQVAAIFPQFSDNESRWSVDVLKAAVPTAAVEPFIVQAWPHHNPRCQRYNGITDIERGESIADIVADQLAAIERDCMASISSVSDCEGVKPRHVPAYVQTVTSALALTWSDPIARHEAQRKLDAIRNRWQLADNGEFDLSIVRAIAQREGVLIQSASALPVVRGYFAERAQASTLAAKIAFTEKHSVSELERAIASVMRAGVPNGERFPANMLAAVKADFANVARVAKIRQAPQAIKRGWNGYIGERLHWVASSAKDHAADATLPARHRAEFAAIAKFSSALSTRRDHKERVTELKVAMVACENARAIVQGMDAASVADADVNETIARCRAFAPASRDLMHAANMVAEFAPKNPALAHEFVTWLQVDGARQETIERAESIIESLRDRAQAAARLERAQQFRGEMARAVELSPTMPRQAFAEASGIASRLQHWNASDNYGEAARDELRVFADATLTAIRAAADNVTPLQEWHNGGAAPGGGDWARVKGSKVVTSRSVTISTRAVQAAMDWLDAQTVQVVSNAGVNIDGYTLTSRDENGTVRVGCHTFYAESVADIRAQLAALQVAA